MTTKRLPANHTNDREWGGDKRVRAAAKAAGWAGRLPGLQTGFAFRRGVLPCPPAAARTLCDSFPLCSVALAYPAFAPIRVIRGCCLYAGQEALL